MLFLPGGGREAKDCVKNGKLSDTGGRGELGRQSNPLPGPAGGTGWRRPALRTREAGLHRAFRSRERGKKSGSPSGRWVTAPGKGGGSVPSEIFGA